MDVVQPVLYSDDNLILRIQQNDHQAFELLYQRYWHPLFLFSRKLLNASADAEDVVQSLFISLWEKRNQLAHVRSLQAYLFQAVRYSALKKLSYTLHNVDIDSVHERFLPVMNSFIETLEHDELVKVIDAKVGELPERTQLIFRMSRFEHLSIDEIACALNLSEQTVKNQLSLALKCVREGIALAMVFALFK